MPHVVSNPAVTELPPPGVLITGASGFLGSALVAECVAKKVNVRCVARSSRAGRLPDFWRIDLAEDKLPCGLFDGIRVVVHAAGLAHQSGGNDRKSQFFRNNTLATQRLVAAAVEAGVEHVILVSSVTVYGSGQTPKAETDACNPQGAYAGSKWEAERRAIRSVRGTPTRLTILRLGPLYGEGDNGNVSRLIRFLDGRWAPFIGRGQNRKSLIHVEDAARAVLAVLRRPCPPDGRGDQVKTYNLAGPPASMRQVTEVLAKALGPARRWGVPAWLARGVSAAFSAVCLHHGPAARLHATVNKWLSSDIYDSTRFEEEFAVRPRISLAAGLSRQARWYRNQNAAATAGPARLAKRCFDVALAALLLALLAVPLVVIGLLVRLTSAGPALYWSKRVGVNNQLFSMAKFRTMVVQTPQRATHLLTNAENWMTPIGGLLRRTSLDELPQLWNILRGQMSFVGPRPALFNQDDLVALRTDHGIDRWPPGITGWAQIHGRDELSIEEKVEFDKFYAEHWSLLLDVKIMLLTAIKAFRGDGVRQAQDAGNVPAAVVLREAGPAARWAVAAFPGAVGAASAAADRLAEQGVCPRVMSVRSATQSCEGEARELAHDVEALLFVAREGTEPARRLPEAILRWQHAATKPFRVRSVLLPAPTPASDDSRRLAQEADAQLVAQAFLSILPGQRRRAA